MRSNIVVAREKMAEQMIRTDNKSDKERLAEDILDENSNKKVDKGKKLMSRRSSTAKTPANAGNQSSSAPKTSSKPREADTPSSSPRPGPSNSSSDQILSVLHAIQSGQNEQNKKIDDLTSRINDLENYDYQYQDYDNDYENVNFCLSLF